MLDFTSSLYLGLRHASHSLAPWTDLTTGKPAALSASPCAATIASELAELQGCESAMLFPSTLHLFFDLFETLRQEGVQVYVDSGAYPIAGWAVERIQALGVSVRRLPHFDVDAACEKIAKDARSGRRPVILADGYCVTCGRLAPLRSYLDNVIPRRGYVVLDDTQALGIWGRHQGPHQPYGKGGGGSLQCHDIRSSRIVVGGSLAKGFGVPIAVLSGSASFIQRLERCGETRVHASPPSLAALNAAKRALAVNASRGDVLRRRLALLVSHFRGRLRGVGLRLPPGLFPVQALAVPCNADPVRLREDLASHGITAAIVSGCDGAASARLVFVITAKHQPRDIERASAILEAVLYKDGRRAAVLRETTLVSNPGF
jgi:8-amino-7-oxononanoate synthase